MAIYVRATCPESPYRVRAQDRKRRIAETLTAGGTLNEDDRAWYSKASRTTGSFALAFLCIPVFMIAMAAGVWLSVPEHVGKELNAIIV